MELKEFCGLSGDARLLYGVILDRASLSMKNGWQDREGRTYVYLSAEEGADILRTTKEKAESCLNELIRADLIERSKRADKQDLLFPKVLFCI